MKKTHANWNTNWNKVLELNVSCPYCEWTNDLLSGDDYDLWELQEEEYSEKDCKDYEFECCECGETFGLLGIYKE